MRLTPTEAEPPNAVCFGAGLQACRGSRWATWRFTMGNLASGARTGQANALQLLTVEMPRRATKAIRVSARKRVQKMKAMNFRLNNGFSLLLWSEKRIHVNNSKFGWKSARSQGRSRLGSPCGGGRGCRNLAAAGGSDVTKWMQTQSKWKPVVFRRPS